MDEIDAALDFKNVSIVANYIKGKTKENYNYSRDLKSLLSLPLRTAMTSQ